ncbi:MAG TPA: nitrate- and nitrite sensing domain-containing protein [Streptosporangiaceae bacterium]|nr:nitrate- and nitrite sensing domain-containing protein [Streptosporangiaceae bacterium]
MLLRIALLVLVPLILLTGSFAYTAATSLSSALTLTRSTVVMNHLRLPVANLQQALSRERGDVILYYIRPTAAARSTLQRQEAVSDRAVHVFMTAAESSAVQRSASAAGKKAIAVTDGGLAGLSGLRSKIANRSMGMQQAFTAYNDVIGASYLVLEQAIIQEGNSAQVLPAIAVVELAVSNEYLQQESALLSANFAAHAFPASAHQAFVSLVGAHRLLYQQSYEYLNAPDRRDLDQDVSPAASAALTAMENKLVASSPGRGALPVHAAVWNGAVTTVSTQTEHAVGQAEALLAATARSQADAKRRDLYQTAGLGLAAVLVSLVLSLWIAVRLTRQLRGLRDSALEMAYVRLPEVVQRLRAGENVDVSAQAPAAESGGDEISQVRAAFSTAQRTAVEAAVDEARVRRGINDVFRNLARRSQALLERQVALLDSLERRASEPDDLEGLFRIDHLTTRMRRHAESLIVLAGDSPNRAFRDAVPFVDVLRAATAEVEDYTRVKVVCRTPAALASRAVADVIHLLAEFVENATTFSPPNTEVRVTGDLVAKGLAVDIEDRGLGMDAEEFAAVNATLANPPLFDPSGSDRLGLFVAAQLARRHDIQVRLRPSDYGGVLAIVLIPPALVVPADGAAGRLSTPPREVTAPRPPVREVTPSAPPREVTAPPAGGGEVTEPGRDVARPPAHARPVTVPPPAVVAPGGNGHHAVVSSPVAATAPDEPLPEPQPMSMQAELTENGLPQRIRQMNLAPQLRDSRAAAPRVAAAASPRSPEKARSVMSAFRQGWRLGLSENGGKQNGFEAHPGLENEGDSE